MDLTLGAKVDKIKPLKKLCFPLSPESFKKFEKPAKKLKREAKCKNTVKRPSRKVSQRRDDPILVNGGANFASSPKNRFELGNDTITLESSNEVELIDASIQEIAGEFDWIKTPATARSRIKDTLKINNLNAKSPDLTASMPRSASNVPGPFKVSRLSDSGGGVSARQIKSIACNDSPFANVLGPIRRRPRASIMNGSPTMNLLKGSKRRNVDAWLEMTAAQPPSTPPMSLSPKRRRSFDSPSNLDPEVKEVLMAVYGKDWEEKAFKKSITDVKKTRRKQLVTAATDGKANGRKKQENQVPHVQKTFFETRPYDSAKPSSKSVRRKIFDDKSPFGSTQFDKFHDLGAKNLDVGNTPCSGVPMMTLLSTNKKKPVKRSIWLSTSSEESPATQTPAIPTTTPSNTWSNAASQVGANSALKTPRRTFLASLSVSTPTSLGHPEAYDYKVNFAKKKDELCAKLFKLYNGEVFKNQLPADLSIKWNSKMRGTAGFCYSKRRKDVRVSRVELAPRVVDRADRLRDTLIHELCHAAAWVVDGVMDGHGAVWLSWAQRAMSRFPELPPIRRCHNYQIATKYTYRCTVCGYSINRQSRSIDTERKRCGHCLGKLELLFNKKKRGETEAPEFNTTRTLRAPNNFALFVKENYKRVKELHPEKKHGDVMKLLSQHYAASKNVS